MPLKSLSLIFILLASTLLITPGVPQSVPPIIQLSIPKQKLFAELLQPYQRKIEKIKAVIVYEASDNFLLFSQNAHQTRPPASLVKMMTAAVIFEALAKGKISLEDEFTVSHNAWEKGGKKTDISKMFLQPDTKVSVNNLLKGLLVQSGNDAALVLAEGLAGSEQEFIARMNSLAYAIGIHNSLFLNATGLPEENMYVSPWDMVLLANYLLQQFPQYMYFFKIKQFSWRNISQNNRNPLLHSDADVNGFKTGFTQHSGYNLVLAAQKYDHQLIVILMGAPSRNSLKEAAEILLDIATETLAPELQPVYNPQPHLPRRNPF